jgi:hypothetical protein
MNKKKYFIAEDGEQKGPFSINELKEMSISKTTLIWQEGFDDWIEAGKIEKLQILLKITPPGLPKNIQKKTKSEKTLNVNLGIGKTKSKIELKEKELAQEKIKTSFANTFIWFLKNSIFALTIALGCSFIANYVVDPAYQREHDFEFISASTIIFILCVYIIFKRPVAQIYNWFNKYSQKEI